MLGNVHIGGTNNSLSLRRDSVNAKIWELLRNAKPQIDLALVLSRKRKKSVEANDDDGDSGEEKDG